MDSNRNGTSLAMRRTFPLVSSVTSLRGTFSCADASYSL